MTEMSTLASFLTCLARSIAASAVCDLSALFIITNKQQLLIKRNSLKNRDRKNGPKLSLQRNMCIDEQQLTSFTSDQIWSVFRAKIFVQSTEGWINKQLCVLLWNSSREKKEGELYSTTITMNSHILYHRNILINCRSSS